MSLSNAVGPVLWSVDGRGVATVTLNRPEVNNAYNGELIQGLLAALDALGGAPGLRAVVIKGNGKHFQAGADLKWIDAVRTASAAENVRVSRATAENEPVSVTRVKARSAAIKSIISSDCAKMNSKKAGLSSPDKRSISRPSRNGQHG